MMRHKNLYEYPQIGSILNSPRQANLTRLAPKKIAVLNAAKFFFIMTTAGVVLISSGTFAPFGVTLTGGIYLAGSIGSCLAVITGLLAYFDAKNNPTYISKKKQDQISNEILIYTGWIAGSSLGGILAASGYFVAAPTILPVMGISCAFGVVFAAFSLASGNRHSNFSVPNTSLPVERKSTNQSRLNHEFKSAPAYEFNRGNLNEYEDGYDSQQDEEEDNHGSDYSRGFSRKC